MLDLGIGLVFPDGRSAGAQAVWPRHFIVDVSLKSKPGVRLRVPFRVAPYIIPSALEPVDELLIVSQNVTASSVRFARAFASKAGLKLVIPEVDEMCDQWMQDTIEPGLFAFPTAEGSRQAPACLTGLRRGSGAAAAGLIIRSPSGSAAKACSRWRRAFPANMCAGTIGTATSKPHRLTPTGRGGDLPMAGSLPESTCSPCTPGY